MSIHCFKENLSTVHTRSNFIFEHCVHQGVASNPEEMGKIPYLRCDSCKNTEVGSFLLKNAMENKETGQRFGEETTAYHAEIIQFLIDIFVLFFKFSRKNKLPNVFWMMLNL